MISINFRHHPLKILFGTLFVVVITIIVMMIRMPRAHASFSGSGTESDPYLISTCADFEALNQASGVFSMTTNLDCSSENNAMMVGYLQNATLDGNGHTLTVNINANASATGIFFYISNSTVKNLKLAGTVLGSQQGNTGALAAHIDTNSFIEYVSSSINVTSQSGDFVGGLAGVMDDSIIKDSYVTGDVSSAGSYTGGLVGYISNNGRIINSYTTGTVSSAGSYTGGLVGAGYYADIINSFSVSALTSAGSVGGIMGVSNGGEAFSNDYYDGTTTGVSNCISNANVGSACTMVNGDALSPNYFKGNSTNSPLTDWNFDTIWNTSTNNFPVLVSHPSDTTLGVAKLTVTDPNNQPVAGATVDVLCYGGMTWAQWGTTDANGVVQSVPSANSAGCTFNTAGKTIGFKIAKAGYLEKETAFNSYYSNGRQYNVLVNPDNSATYFGYPQATNTYALTLHPLGTGGTDTYTVEYWNTGHSDVPEIPDSDPDYTTTAATIDSHLASDTSPAPGHVDVNYYTARYSKTVHFDAGSYTFTACSDDGERTYLDGSMVMDNWVARGTSCDTVTVDDISAGDHTVTLEYFQQGGGQSVSFSYDSDATSSVTNVYESADTEVTPNDPGTENFQPTSYKAKDGSYLTTALSADDNGYDSQVFKFAPDFTNISNPIFNINWSGHGAVPDGKKVYLSIWNAASSAWEQLATEHCATDCDLTGSVTGSNYKDGDNVWLWAKADNSYVPPVISNLTDNTGLLPIQWDTDQDATTALAYDTVSHDNYDDYDGHINNNDLVTSHSLTPAVSDNNSQNWRSVTTSSDGTKVAAVVNCGDIWTSVDSGTTWTDQSGAGSRCWTSISMTPNGNTLVAVESGGNVWSGAFDGTNWTWTDLSTVSTNYPSGSKNWNSIKLSSDGLKLAVSGWNTDVWAAVNNSGTWTWTATNLPYSTSQKIAMSDDGTKIVAGGWCTNIYIGTFDGSSWSWSEQSGTGACWSSFGMSADGTKVIAGRNYGQPWVGTFDGTNWSWSEKTTGPYGWWDAATITRDGSKMVLGSDCAAVYTSTDGGNNWTIEDGGLQHCNVGAAISDSGTKIYMANSNADIVATVDNGTTWIPVTATKWYYRVKSINANGLATISDEQSFRFASSSSCPFVFTWNGSNYQFVIDASNSGILGTGLDNTLWKANPWYKEPLSFPNPLSYAKIPTGSLVPTTNGNETFYDIKTMTQLDETNYFDKSALEVIDHSPAVNVFPDYRNNGQFHTIAKNAPAPVSVTDQTGQDVKELIAADDNTYWHSRLAGSATDATYLTIKLTNDPTTPAHLKILLKGTKEGPTGGSKGGDKLQYKNASGQFVNVPANKDIFTVTRDGASRTSRNLMNTYGVQTKVIDLSGMTIKDNTIRLATTNNIRQWDIDQILVDTSDDSAMTVTEETPYAADLHERGVAKMVLVNPNDPKMSQLFEPDYDQLIKTKGKGFPLSGNATKYGDVTPLLSSVDNKFVIMTQGDELSLKYAVPAIADGMERDFIYNTWDYHKPSHVALGDTIDELPFSTMTTYPYHLDQEHYPTDAEHQEYRNTYNTRVIDWGTSQESANVIHHSLNTDKISLEVTGVDVPTPKPRKKTYGYSLGGTTSPTAPSTTPAKTTPDLCPANQILSQNLKAPSQNGKYNSYTKGIVTEAKILQAHLNRLGFKSGSEDGILGPISIGAIKRMQIFLGTKPDGFVGPITRGLINNSCGGKGLQKQL